MTLEEFVKVDPKQIRNDKELMQLFVKYYEAAFSFLPSCVGCSFKSSFKKLKRYANSTDVKQIKTNKTMISKKTFQLKSKYRLKILTYKLDGKTHRCYGYNLTEDFAKALVKAGKSDLFIKLPDGQKDVKEIEVVKPVEIIEKIDYNALDYRTELVPLYNKVKDETDRKAKSYGKADIIEFLENEH